ncbi:MAG: aminopeptidase P [uncultured bacterium]|nr:MAG: aminopeptidase P [uncultured bacterium]OGN55647.1 MAG: hypothetical protein A2796_00530 [Chlamydiae bacterium RIFCSPHIGHO2_01_FULL_44_39]OGN57254.1 MAG: hypothetical protein A3C42_04375 [Chlamydiae bacterium RIFCSPHIGHO2_02_FULL_45_9]OGN60439.1 MAG: hypothetical protein A3D96_00955 [Chlamydiae bacterium RIFCSPHIGHO2_12_FULL_44_59]OGN66560.1 MAG: hypothetical protein A2978_05140 [Chlamydiae bacterium RIFCSPLOWO2_01_FULL_44_52]OGN69809.1 MAG: hypothetical protein A3I67_06895 [Chlamydiae 
MAKSRLQRLQIESDISLLIEKPIDLLYFTGLHLSRGRLFVEKERVRLFVDGRYFHWAADRAPCEVLEWDAFLKVDAKKVQFDSTYLSYDGFVHYQKLCPGIEWIPEPHLTSPFRKIKEAKEIHALRKAARLTLLGIEHVAQMLKVGVTEKELVLEFELFILKHGAEKLSFEPIIAFGKNSAFPHHRSGYTPLSENAVVLIDAGAVVDEYAGDLTRVYYFQKPDPNIVRLEKIVEEAQAKALSLIRPGILLKELDRAVREIFSRENVKQFYMHSLGHGIGLEVHEFPLIRETAGSEGKIEEGMVFTIEPGLYEPGRGGVRLEEMVEVTETGSRLLVERGVDTVQGM